MDYARMQATATRLLTNAAQGSVVLRKVVRGAGENAWTPSAPTTTDYPLHATVKRNRRAYIGGTMVIEQGDQVMFAVPPVVPDLSDTLIIDGVERTITELKPIPAAGTVAAWHAWCAA